jgi:thiopurine S-methyltransferase
MNSAYWSLRYQNKQTGWDIGEASKPLLKLFEKIENKDDKILIPGCGNAYEAEYLFDSGYKNIYIIDIAEEPILAFKNRNPNFPKNQILLGDFFKHKGSYNVIIEQTFFCAIDPELRPRYVNKCYDLLKKNGKLLGVLFNREFEGGPPFGGNKKEYQTLFENVFTTVRIINSIHSIPPRMGNEVTIACKK